MIIQRSLKNVILESAKDSRVVLLNGARQSGKSTLVKALFEPVEPPGYSYVNLDNLTTLRAARESPQSFLQGLAGRIIIDEIQRAPELFLPIKEIVDFEDRPGRFIITSSANVLNLPKLADTLAGRMELHTLWPLSQGEIRGKQECFIDALFGVDKLVKVKSIESPELLRIVISGGYPEVLRRQGERSRANWFGAYLTTILERDVRELSNIDALTSMPDLLALLASRAGSLVNLADLSRSLDLPYTSLKRYLVLLEAVFLVVMLPPWFSNIGKRLVKSDKVYLNDTGLLCHLLDADCEELAKNRTLFGSIFENFVVMELLKQSAWSRSRPKLFHFRTVKGQEVDIVLQKRNGKIVGVECKASSTISKDHFSGLRALKELTGESFHRGVILYTGSESVSFANDMEAVPISALWETAQS